jgi:branched-chain amino acid transport system substrate-binding protein
MKHILLAGITAVTLSGLTGLGLGHAAAETGFTPGLPVRIGMVFPLTGGSADMGNSARVGAQAAVNEINRSGGYLGRPLELVIRDDQSSNEVGRTVTQDLVLKEKVSATIGFCNTGVAMNSLDVFQSNKHVLIVPCSTGSALTDKYPAAESFIFRVAASSKMQTQFIVNDIVKRKLSKVVLLVDSTGYGDAGLKDLESALASVKLSLHKVVRFKLGVQSLEAEMKSLQESGADALIGWSVGPEQGVIAASRMAIGWKVQQYGDWNVSHASAHKTSGGKVEGVAMVQTVVQNSFLERNSAFQRTYTKLSSEKPIGSFMSAAQSYDAVHLLLRAIFTAKGDLSGPALKLALENQPFPYRGVVTTYEKPFSDKDHEAFSTNMLWMGTWKNQDRTYFYPDDEKQATVIRRKQLVEH